MRKFGICRRHRRCKHVISCIRFHILSNPATITSNFIRSTTPVQTIHGHHQIMSVFFMLISTFAQLLIKFVKKVVGMDKDAEFVNYKIHKPYILNHAILQNINVVS
jgi:hypothetical protein